MEVLAERLSHLDPEAGGAVRVVMFFDTLMRRRVDLAALTRASATLAECVTGVRLHGTGHVIRAAPNGLDAPETEGAASTTLPIVLDDEPIGAVWLERSGPPLSLDDLVLDRLALAAAGVVERYGPARTTMADPALVELVISADTDEAARARALRLLGFGLDAPIRVAAVRSRRPLDQVGGFLSPNRLVKAAPLTDVGVVLATTLDVTRLPPDVRAGVGSAANPDESWREARTALRFTTAREPVLRHDDLGALALLAQVPPDVARANVDVAAIAALTDNAEDLDTLDAYCATGSQRRAAELLHLHHSSIARRLDQIGASLGIDLSHPTGLTRARLALTTWRLLED
ncbi:helix-turn-helix domain-containing protein [Spiractinospora alimapuensis]|uniref:PucR family transcriptional regulator n=1 Tax=Spiractinospora alimapuensis TaxID=2820884 RepID=UPI001F3B73B9|nr:helix-turn-helix domain-containing protein [Spiractinospora alimapuensis]QVQ52821.1 helix-turn-helix domain-containing protein [Spiractinospora alimapuensis]